MTEAEKNDACSGVAVDAAQVSDLKRPVSELSDTTPGEHDEPIGKKIKVEPIETATADACDTEEQVTKSHDGTFESADQQEIKDEGCSSPDVKTKQPSAKKGRKQGRVWVPREDTGEPKEPKLPKRKVALLMGYCGTGYNGMQINPGVETIELELHKALAAAGAVSKDNAMDPHKIAFMRAARTDKGVHAAGQVCSLKMIIEDPDIVTKINSHLPEQIRIWGFVRTNRSFHAKNACDARIYEYFLPTYVLQAVDPRLYPLSAVGKKAGIKDAQLSFDYVELPKTEQKDLENKRSFRIEPEQLDLLRSILKEYEGTHNFHNFTVNKRFEDRSANRYIISFEASDPIIRGGIEWVKCKVLGQSFMLHQIRKMIGLAIMMVRTGTPASLVERTFENEKLNIPKAPALGLLLDKTLFRMYNQKRSSGEDDAVDFNKYQDVIDEFKEKWIYSKLVQEELNDAQFDEWARVIDSRSAEYAWYFNDDATISTERRPPYLEKGAKGLKSDRPLPPGAVDLVGDLDDDAEGGDE
ncbi:tRNA pseudouridine synthase A [Spizellomyces punctatus DAOM BR117]|uniref:tRNA pseudouridine synthase A n=1 Tax=Spizellomyces punctatus (strain DAOM BR117) TaxID=645134 RepID=A0A0L0HQ10_SPIPD|nr:tRNA pseudouridine synthase A [Spizellomyces punctatus DAOM BR117]KND03511.1 tRNA pseudouridine synthase A [Spizellomyces punctatus DAOM BR117]|eukprot:XP_016611550.1 tRNA pseudouridine synthase A [Spizellomyces punctatus DAOM BR117]